jgi:hypothetical protein
MTFRQLPLTGKSSQQATGLQTKGNMGTRCLTVFKEESGTEIAVLYRQMDGYLEGHGEDLQKFLTGKKLVNGFGRNDTKDNCFNGMSCLAASVVAHFKTGLGASEEFVYTIYPKGSVICLTVQGGYEKDMSLIYDGPAAEFNAAEAKANPC